jgi:hypothetical protein
MQTDVVKDHATTVTCRNLKVGRNNIAPQGLVQLLAFSLVFDAMPFGYRALRPSSLSALATSISLTPKNTRVTTTV